MNNFKKMSLLLAILTFSLVGCNKTKQESETFFDDIEVSYVESGEDVTIVDSFDREVTFRKDATERVVCLGAGALRIYSYVGNMDKLVGVEQIDKEPFGVGTALRPYYHVHKDLFATLPLVGQGGPMAQAPEYERIVEVAPTLIISIYSSLETNNEITTTTNIPVIAIKQGGNSFFASEFIFSLKLLGKVFKNEDRANDLINYLGRAKQDLEDRTSNVTRANAYLGSIGNWGRTNAYGTMANCPILKYAGINNVVDSISNVTSPTNLTIDAEKLIELDPSKIFLDGAGLSGFLDDYKVNKNKYDVLSAFKNDEVYILLPYNAYYTNIEIGLMSAYFTAKTAYPHEFNDIDITNKCNEISKIFLGKEIYEEIKTYSTAYGGYGKLNLEELVK